MSPANLTNPFGESCCDGGATSNAKSCQPCGCDEGANWMCQRHTIETALKAVKETVENEPTNKGLRP